MRSAAAVDQAQDGDLAFLWDSKYLPEARSSQASAIVCEAPIEGCPAPQIVVADAKQAMLMLLGEVYGMRFPPGEAGVHPSAFVDPSAQVDPSASVGPQAVVEAESVVGPKAQIRARAYVGRSCAIGERSIIHPNSSQ